jgi:hypothetical protein
MWKHSGWIRVQHRWSDVPLLQKGVGSSGFAFGCAVTWLVGSGEPTRLTRPTLAARELDGMLVAMIEDRIVLLTLMEA